MESLEVRRSVGCMRNSGKYWLVLCSSLRYCCRYKCIVLTNALILCSAKAVEGSKRYIARHAFPLLEALATHRDIQGYGVFLDIKNMEYRNAAEHTADGDGAEGGEIGKKEDEENFQFDPDEEVEGVVFSTLQTRFPHLTKELKMAREELVTQAEVSGDSTEMKMWKVLDLGLQTTQSIVTASSSPSASSTESVTAMNTLLHNFPKHASSLSSVHVDDELKETVIHYYRSGAMGSIPVNSLFINGLRIDLAAATLNIFDIISNIRQELKNSDYLTRKGVSADVKKELLRHAAGLTGDSGINPAATREEQMLEYVKSVKRVDVSKGGKYAIQFLNNLEKDAQYKRLPKSVMTLLQPSWQLTGLSRNIYTLVVVVNPVSVEGASMLFQLNQIYEQQYPVRIGVVWACDAVLPETVAAANGASAEDVCHLFSEAKAKFGFRAGKSNVLHSPITIILFSQIFCALFPLMCLLSLLLLLLSSCGYYSHSTFSLAVLLPRPALAVVSRITNRIEEEAEDKFEPSFTAAQGSIASSAAPQNNIFVTKEQVAELYAGKCMHRYFFVLLMQCSGDIQHIHAMNRGDIDS